MNEKLSRPQFNQMDTTEKQTLMESLAARYTMTFLDLHTFDRWGQSSTTGIFEKDGRKFVFVPGDTVTLGWEQFAVGLNQESREELDDLVQEWEMEPQNPEEMIRESMAPVRQAVIGPMLVGRELEELCWEPVKMDDPRLTAHPDWLKEFRDFAWSDSSSLTLHQSARIERTEDGFHTWIYHCTDYDALLAGLEKQGLSLPTADEWAYHQPAASYLSQAPEDAALRPCGPVRTLCGPVRPQRRPCGNGPADRPAHGTGRGCQGCLGLKTATAVGADQRAARNHGDLVPA